MSGRGYEGKIDRVRQFHMNGSCRTELGRFTSDLLTRLLRDLEQKERRAMIFSLYKETKLILMPTYHLLRVNDFFLHVFFTP